MDTYVPTRVPIRAAPLREEGLNGFLARVAEVNHFDRVWWIAEAAGVRFPQPWYKDDEIERFSAVTGVSADELREIAPSLPYETDGGYASRAFGHPVPADAFIRKDFRRVCPACLAEAPHHRLMWDLRFVRSCIHHRTKLLAECLACGRRLSWRTRSVSECRCGMPLNVSLPPELFGVNEQVQAGSRFLQNMLLGNEQHVPPFLTGLEFDQVFQLLREFARVRGPAAFKLNNSVDDGVEEVLARGLTVISQEADCLEWELKTKARRWLRPEGGRMVRELEVLYGWLRATQPSAPHLTEIVRRVLEDPPEEPGARPSGEPKSG